MPVADAIVQIIRRHPIQESNLLEILNSRQPDQVQEMLATLESGGQARQHSYRGQVFWEYAGGKFAGQP